MFYLYKYAPSDSKTWDIGFMTLESGGFRSVQSFVHALFTKITFLILTTLFYFTARYWWRYFILVPFTMFLFQLSGVLNYKIQYIDEYDFWYSLPIVIPVLVIMFFLGRKLHFYTATLDLKDEIDKELEQIKQEQHA